MKNEFKIISDLLPKNCRVLDVGCGDGTLMQHLSSEKNIDVRGLELEEDNVKICISKGLSVIEGDAETELDQFPDKSFDYVILSQTLQAFYSPVNVLEHLLRIGKSSIVSIPNSSSFRVIFILSLRDKDIPDCWAPSLRVVSYNSIFNVRSY